MKKIKRRPTCCIASGLSFAVFVAIYIGIFQLASDNTVVGAATFKRSEIKVIDADGFDKNVIDYPFGSADVSMDKDSDDPKRHRFIARFRKRGRFDDSEVQAAYQNSGHRKKPEESGTPDDPKDEAGDGEGQVQNYRGEQPAETALDHKDTNPNMSVRPTENTPEKSAPTPHYRNIQTKMSLNGAYKNNQGRMQQDGKTQLEAGDTINGGFQLKESGNAKIESSQMKESGNTNIEGSMAKDFKNQSPLEHVHGQDHSTLDHGKKTGEPKENTGQIKSNKGEELRHGTSQESVVKTVSSAKDSTADVNQTESSMVHETGNSETNGHVNQVRSTEVPTINAASHQSIVNYNSESLRKNVNVTGTWKVDMSRVGSVPSDSRVGDTSAKEAGKSESLTEGVADAKGLPQKVKRINKPNKDSAEDINKKDGDLHTVKNLLDSVNDSNLLGRSRSTPASNGSMLVDNSGKTHGDKDVIEAERHLDKQEKTGNAENRTVEHLGRLSNDSLSTVSGVKGTGDVTEKHGRDQLEWKISTEALHETNAEVAGLAGNVRLIGGNMSQIPASSLVQTRSNDGQISSEGKNDTHTMNTSDDTVNSVQGKPEVLSNVTDTESPKSKVRVPSHSPQTTQESERKPKTLKGDSGKPRHAREADDSTMDGDLKYLLQGEDDLAEKENEILLRRRRGLSVEDHNDNSQRFKTQMPESGNKIGNKDDGEEAYKEARMAGTGFSGGQSPDNMDTPADGPGAKAVDPLKTYGDAEKPDRTFDNFLDFLTLPTAETVKHQAHDLLDTTFDENNNPVVGEAPEFIIDENEPGDDNNDDDDEDDVLDSNDEEDDDIDSTDDVEKLVSEAENDSNLAMQKRIRKREAVTNQRRGDYRRDRSVDEDDNSDNDNIKITATDEKEETNENEALTRNKRRGWGGRRGGGRRGYYRRGRSVDEDENSDNDNNIKRTAIDEKEESNEDKELTRNKRRGWGGRRGGGRRGYYRRGRSIAKNDEHNNGKNSVEITTKDEMGEENDDEAIHRVKVTNEKDPGNDDVEENLTRVKRRGMRGGGRGGGGRGRGIVRGGGGGGGRDRGQKRYYGTRDRGQRRYYGTRGVRHGRSVEANDGNDNITDNDMKVADEEESDDDTAEETLIRTKRRASGGHKGGRKKGHHHGHDKDADVADDTNNNSNTTNTTLIITTTNNNNNVTNTNDEEVDESTAEDNLAREKRRGRGRGRGGGRGYGRSRGYYRGRYGRSTVSDGSFGRLPLKHETETKDENNDENDNEIRKIIKRETKVTVQHPKSTAKPPTSHDHGETENLKHLKVAKVVLVNDDGTMIEEFRSTGTKVHNRKHKGNKKHKHGKGHGKKHEFSRLKCNFTLSGDNLSKPESKEHHKGGPRRTWICVEEYTPKHSTEHHGGVDGSKAAGHHSGDTSELSSFQRHQRHGSYTAIHILVMLSVFLVVIVVVALAVIRYRSENARLERVDSRTHLYEPQPRY